MLLTLLIRDVVKLCRSFMHSLVARLFYVKRMSKTWIHCTARLDILPIHGRKYQTLNKFTMKKGSCVEARTTINTWHGDVFLNDNTGIGIGSIVIGPVHIGANTSVAQNCFISGINHQYQDGSQSFQSQGYVTKKVDIGDDVWIGANCVILPGVSIGSNSVIGAGCVVTKDVPPYSVVVGNPAQVVKRYDINEKRWLKV